MTTTTPSCSTGDDVKAFDSVGAVRENNYGLQFRTSFKQRIPSDKPLDLAPFHVLIVADSHCDSLW